MEEQLNWCFSKTEREDRNVTYFSGGLVFGRLQPWSRTASHSRHSVATLRERGREGGREGERERDVFNTLHVYDACTKYLKSVSVAISCLAPKCIWHCRDNEVQWTASDAARS